MKESKREKESKKVNVSKEVCMIINNVNDIKGGKQVKKAINAYYAFIGDTVNTYSKTLYIKKLSKNDKVFYEKEIQNYDKTIAAVNELRNYITEKIQLITKQFKAYLHNCFVYEMVEKKLINQFNAAVKINDINAINECYKELLDAINDALQRLNVYHKKCEGCLRNGIPTNIKSELAGLFAYNYDDLFSVEAIDKYTSETKKELLNKLEQRDFEKVVELAQTLNYTTSRIFYSNRFYLNDLNKKYQKMFEEKINEFNGDEEILKLLKEFLENKVTLNVLIENINKVVK